MDQLPFEVKQASATPDQKEFRAWMKANREHFLEDDYTAEEVGLLARLAGFDALLVYRELSHFQDALNGTNIDNRIAMELFRFDYAIEQVNKMKDDMAGTTQVDLMPLWKELADYQSGL